MEDVVWDNVKIEAINYRGGKGRVKGSVYYMAFMDLKVWELTIRNVQILDIAGKGKRVKFPTRKSGGRWWSIVTMSERLHRRLCGVAMEYFNSRYVVGD